MSLTTRILPVGADNNPTRFDIKIFRDGHLVAETTADPCRHRALEKAKQLRAQYLHEVCDD